MPLSRVVRRSAIVLVVGLLALTARQALSDAPKPPQGGPPPQGGAPPARNPWAPPAPGTKAEQHYQNIQAFKGLPAEDLMPAMQFMSAALGVDCDHCHVERAPEKDDKRAKQAARRMIAMTRAINDGHFKGEREVTCYTCHRGSDEPERVPSVDVKEHDEEEAPAAPAETPVAPILEKFLAASGGAEALHKVTSRVMKGTMSGAGPQPFPVTVYAAAPNQRATVVETPRGESVTAFDGKGGWLGGGMRPPRDMSPAESAAASLDAEFWLPETLGKRFDQLRVLPDGKVDGKPARHVLAKHGSDTPVEFWFDAASGLLLRVVKKTETPLGQLPTQIDYTDYRAEGGVTLPHAWSVARPGSRFEIRITDVQQNVAIEASRFRKP